MEHAVNEFEVNQTAGHCSYCDNAGPTQRAGVDRRVQSKVEHLEMCEFCWRMGCGPDPGDHPDRENFSRLARTIVAMTGRADA